MSSSPLSLGSSISAASLTESIIDRAVLPGLLQHLASIAATFDNAAHCKAKSLSAIQCLLADLKIAGANQAALLIAPVVFPSIDAHIQRVITTENSGAFDLQDAVDAAARVLLRHTTLPWISRSSVAGRVCQNDIDSDSSCHTLISCLLYTSPSPRDQRGSRMPSSA